ncbi:nudix hydrolase 15, mitochondrial-like [Actinidia eriantha]|uniref:nudix hydrolase 15, mitochondrial-like n=1 Tax=Actinidia eriantha TaxID=165200 RepID=UPI00258ED6B6|nr:nudix hydrolase 15, mitochondrial-like [Actinidia eriantha]
MASSNMAASQRLVNLAQQLRLFKPLYPPSNTMEDPTHQENVVHREQSSNPGSETNPIPKSPEKIRPKRAAVLICLFEGENGDLRVILTKRSSTLSTHSGDVALPGGKREEGDADDIETALREAKEEIGLDPSLVDVVTVLEPFSTKIGMAVVPVVGILVDNRAFIPTPNAAEVAAIFDAPLDMFLKNENRRAEEREWMGHKYLLHFFDYEAENGKYVIWALTAGILISVASLVYQQPPDFQERRPQFWTRSL